jgi:GNAT superfamily N-acetyltransferase
MAVLPLSAWHGMHRSLTNWHTPRLEIPAASSAARRALLRQALRATDMPIQLAMLTAGSDDAHAFVTVADEEGVRVVPRTVARSPVVRLEGSYADYERTLAPHRRAELVHWRARLERIGTLSFDVEKGSERLYALLGDRFEASPDTRAFYRDVAAWAAARGSLRLAFLRLEGQPIAFHFTIEERGSAYRLASGDDPRFRDYAVAELLMEDAIKWAFARGVSSYEFLDANEAFGRSWTAGLLERITLHAFPPSASRASSASSNPGASPNSRISRRRKAS